MAERGATVTLLTDFGTKDCFVGVMKGVLASIAPGTTVIDLCHEVPPQGIVEAGCLLASAYAYFPPGTIHVAVVDPGVGTDRAVLAIEAKGFRFLVPDNGLIVPTLVGPEEADSIVRVENAACFLKPVSRTFHGRDIFAPAAAHLARGAPLASLGPAVREFDRGSFPAVMRAALPDGGELLAGEVVHVDRFGNLITNIRGVERERVSSLACAGREVAGLQGTFADVSEGALLAFIGSSGFLEVAVRGGSAAAQLRARAGEKIHVRLRNDPKYTE